MRNRKACAIYTSTAKKTQMPICHAPHAKHAPYVCAWFSGRGRCVRVRRWFSCFSVSIRLLQSAVVISSPSLQFAVSAFMFHKLCSSSIYSSMFIFPCSHVHVYVHHAHVPLAFSGGDFSLDWQVAVADVRWHQVHFHMHLPSIVRSAMHDDPPSIMQFALCCTRYHRLVLVVLIVDKIRIFFPRKHLSTYSRVHCKIETDNEI